MDHTFSNANFPFGLIWTTIEFTLQFFENNTVSVKVYICFQIVLLKFWLKCKIYREKLTNFKTTNLCCVWPFLVMCTVLFQILSNQLCLANSSLYLIPETITNQTNPISIRVQSDLRQRQHFFSVVHFTPVGWWMCISHYISWTKLSKETNFVWY